AGGWRTWHPGFLLGQDISGATLGLVGLGRIGAAVARRARGFGMRLRYTGPRPKPELAGPLGAEYRADLTQLLAESDFVSVHAPLSSDTHHLFDARAFAAMRPTATFVNTSRGGLVDQAALADALRAGRPANVALAILGVGLFSSAEAALISAKEVRLRRMAEEGNAGAKAALRLRAQHDKLFAAVLLSEDLLTVFASAFGTALALHFLGEGGV